MFGWFSKPTVVPTPQDGASETKMEIQQSLESTNQAQEPEPEPEPKPSPPCSLLIDLGGCFVRSSLHLGTKDTKGQPFRDLQTKRMEFVLNRFFDMDKFLKFLERGDVVAQLKVREL